jgi:hypothetical protein
MARTLLVVALGAAAALYGLYGRGYPVSLALILGMAVGAVVWVAWRTWDRLRELHGRG